MTIKELIRKVVSELKDKELDSECYLQDNLIDLEIGLNGLGDVADVNRPVSTVRVRIKIAYPCPNS